MPTTGLGGTNPMDSPRHRRRRSSIRTDRLRWRRAGALVALALTLGAACATEPKPEGERAPTFPAGVRVVNTRYDDITVWLERGDARVLLGSVAARGSASFGVRKDVVGPGLALVAVPAGSERDWVSGAFALGRGQVALWTIRDPFADSTLLLR